MVPQDDNQPQDESEKPFTMAPAGPGDLDPSRPPQQFLGQILDKVVGSGPVDSDAIVPDTAAHDAAALILSGGIAPVVERLAATDAAQALGQQAGRFFADEAGMVKLPGAAPVTSAATPQSIAQAQRATSAVLDAGEHIGNPNYQDAAQLLNRRVSQAPTSFRPKRPAFVKPGYADGGEVEPSDAGHINIFDVSGDAPVLGTIAPEEATDAVAGGNYTFPKGAPIPVISPEGEQGTIDPSEAPEAFNNGYKYATDADIKEAKYGTTGQMLKTAAEGIAQGATFGLSTGAETVLGIATPEDIRGRAETNPGIHNLSQVGGLAASSLIPGVGEAGLLRAGGEGAAGALGLAAKGAGFISQVGADTVKGAFEAGLFQGGEEVSKAFTKDPKQTAAAAVADMGLATVLGGVFSGALGAGLRKAGLVGDQAVAAAAVEGKLPPAFVSQLDRAAVDAGDFRATIQNSNIIEPKDKLSILEGLGKQKPEAKEIEAAASRLGAPVMEGMTSASPIVQKAEDSLINGAATHSGLKRRELYQQGYDKAAVAVENALGDGSRYSKAELGDIFQKSIISKIEEQNAPIKKMYEYIKQYHDIIPVSKEAIPEIKDALKQLPALRLSPSSPEGRLANSIMKELGNIKTVDDVKLFKTGLNDRLSGVASKGERRVVAIVADKLGQLEEHSVSAFAKAIPKNDEAGALISSLIDERKKANSIYKPFIADVQTLLDQLGKGRVHGAQDAIGFIKDLTPEQITKKLFDKNNSKFLDFFEKKFPEEMQLMKEYQKGLLRETASKTGELSPKVLFNNVNKLEPEIQKKIFHSDELQALRDAETYLRSFPKNHNPSGTSGMSAFREFFEHPTGALIGNARDFAIEKFIKAVGASPEVKNAASLAKSTVAGIRTTVSAVKSVFNPDKLTLPASISVSTAARDKIKKLVDEYTKSPEKMANIGDHCPIPEYVTSFASTAGRAVQFLGGIKPNAIQMSPLDAKIPPTPAQMAAYDRAIDIAQQPLMVLKHIKEGVLTASDLVALKAVHPDMYGYLNEKMSDQLLETVNKGKTVPYQIRMGLSLFMGQALDSTMLPASIVAAQPSQGSQGPEQGQQQSPQPAKHSTSALNKLSNNYRTPAQASQARRESLN